MSNWLAILLGVSPLLIPLVALAVGGTLGSLAERRHLRDLDARELSMRSRVLVTQLRTPPEGRDARLVLGHAVIASDYFKFFAASMRTLVGGEVKSYRPVLERGRREALARAMESAIDAGADQLVNVRFATTAVNPMAVEILCYGTALRTSVR